LAKLTNRLDDLQIKHWMAKGDPIAKSDGEGLTFTLSKAGTATWVLRYRQGAGRRKELTIGNYPDISLSAARREARKVRVEIDNGVDPAGEKQKQKAKSASAWTVKMLSDDFQSKRLTTPPLAVKTVSYRVTDLEKVVVPKLGKREVTDVGAIDIVHMIKTSGRPWSTSKRLLLTTSQLFDHACGLQIIPANPCTGVKLSSLLGKAPPVRKRIMLDELELRKLLSKIRCMNRENALAFKILLTTCVRTVELIKARREHLDFDRNTWWVPDEAVKTRAGFLVPLVPTVAQWFKDLLALAGDSEWVLPARREKRNERLGYSTHVGHTTLWSALKRAFERGDIDIRRFTPHDTRSTAKGHMRNMGVSREISEIALNHVLKGVEGIYDVRTEIPERREALELWAAFIVACEKGQPIPVTNQQVAG